MTALSGTTYLTDPGTTVLNSGSTVTGTVYLDAGHVLDIAGTVSSSKTTVQLGSSGGATSAGGGKVIIAGSGHLDAVGDIVMYSGSGSALFQNNGTFVAKSNASIQVPFVNTGSATIEYFLYLGGRNQVSDSNRGTINNSGDFNIAVPTFYNAATFNNSGSGSVSIGYPGVSPVTFVNQKNATFNFIGDYSTLFGDSYNGQVGVFTNYGHLAKTSGTGSNTIQASYIGVGGDISIATGSLLFESSHSSITLEDIKGPGTLEVGFSAHLVLGAGTTVSTGGLSVFTALSYATSLPPSILRLDEDLDYAGTYSQDASTLVLGSHTMTLSGPAAFSGVPGLYSSIDGTGTLVLTGSTSLSGTNLLSSAVVQNSGTVSQTGNIGVGDPTNGTARIVNAAGATWTIANDALIAGDSTHSAFINDGTLIKQGSAGRSVIAPSVKSSAGGAGLVAVQDGSLELARDVSGHEALQTQGASTLILDAGASADTSFSFIGSGGTLQLGDAADFHGSISNFASTDLLDIRSVAFSGQSLAYQGTGPASGTLTLSDGAHSAALSLLGTYTPGSFHVASDQHGGTLITVV